MDFSILAGYSWGRRPPDGLPVSRLAAGRMDFSGILFCLKLVWNLIYTKIESNVSKVLRAPSF